MLTRLTLRMGLLAIPMSFPFELEADDCNQNRVADSKDIEAGRSADCNRNAVPDECDVRPSDFGFTILQSLMPLGEAPLMMVSTDLDGDGNLDLITANFGTWEIKGKTLSILWGKGDGTLESPLILPVRAWPQLGSRRLGRGQEAGPHRAP